MITRRSYDSCISCKRLEKGQLKIYVQIYRLLKIIKQKLMKKPVYYLSNLFLQRKFKKKINKKKCNFFYKYGKCGKKIVLQTKWKICVNFLVAVQVKF